MFRFAVAGPFLTIVLATAVALVIIYLYLNFKKARRAGSLQFSDLKPVAKVRPSLRLRLRSMLPILRAIAFLLLIIGLARPQSGRKLVETTSEGIDIILALDTSGSMKAEDFKPQNRLGAAKEVIKEFIRDHMETATDRIGLVVFSRMSFTQCPLTLDYGVLEEFVDKVDFGMIEDGTAIGLAIANGVNRLKDSAAKSKVIILLTDGINNAGEIDPVTAAEIARTYGIKIYTVGVGKPGSALYPVDDPIFGKRYITVENEIDEESLRKVAEITGGMYFRAKDEKGLSLIYKQISEMEKTEFKVNEYMEYTELFMYFVAAGLAVLLLEILLANTYFRRLP